MLSHKDKVKYIFDNYYDKMDNIKYVDLSIPLFVEYIKLNISNDYFVNYIKILCNSGKAIFNDVDTSIYLLKYS